MSEERSEAQVAFIEDLAGHIIDTARGIGIQVLYQYYNRAKQTPYWDLQLTEDENVILGYYTMAAASTTYPIHEGTPLGAFESEAIQIAAEQYIGAAQDKEKAFGAKHLRHPLQNLGQTLVVAEAFIGQEDMDIQAQGYEMVTQAITDYKAATA